MNEWSTCCCFPCLADAPFIYGQVCLELLSLQQKIPHNEPQTAHGQIGTVSSRKRQVFFFWPIFITNASQLDQSIHSKALQHFQHTGKSSGDNVMTEHCYSNPEEANTFEDELQHWLMLAARCHLSLFRRWFPNFPIFNTRLIFSFVVCLELHLECKYWMVVCMLFYFAAWIPSTWCSFFRSIFRSVKKQDRKRLSWQLIRPNRGAWQVPLAAAVHVDGCAVVLESFSDISVENFSHFCHFWKW